MDQHKATAPYVAVIVALLLVSLTKSDAPVIITPPMDITAFQDQKPAVFKCEVNGDLPDWRVNGTIFNNLSPEIRTDLTTTTDVSPDSNTLLTLTIPAKADYNLTKVACGALSLSRDFITSEEVSFKIQGALSSVVDIKIASTATSINISWSAPFSLDVTDIDPDIWYSVFIYNITDEPTTLISCTDCINITETQYTFTPDYPSPCHKYKFTIIPFNGVGQGRSSDNITDNTIPDITITRVGLRDVNSSKSTVIFTVNGEVERVCDYTLHTISDDGNGMIETLSLKNDETLQDGGNIIYTLSDNKYYCSVYFEIESGTASFNKSQHDFTTFDLQTPSAVEDDNMITVSGTFITDSLARGCFIVIEDTSNDADIFVAIEREGSEQVITESIAVPPASYIVYAYDLEENALPHHIPVDIPSSEIIINTPYNEPTITSEFLDSATITLDGLTVTVDCEFAGVLIQIIDMLEPSCVLVYREYGNSTLNVITYYKKDTSFPVSITIDNPGKIYTFAIFGRDGTTNNIDRLPLTSTRVELKKNDGDNATPQLTSAGLALLLYSTVFSCIIV